MYLAFDLKRVQKSFPQKREGGFDGVKDGRVILLLSTDNIFQIGMIE